MGLYTQSPDNRLLTSTQALPAWAVIAFTLFEYLANVFSPQNHLDYPAHPVVRASRTVPLPASRVILSGPSSAVASSSVIAVVFGVLLVFYVMVISLVCWSFKCAATSKGRPHGRSSPSHSSPPTDIDERDELLEDEANSDVLVDQSSDGEDEEANGDGDDPGDDQNDNIDEVNKGSVLRPLSSAEDPPPRKVYVTPRIDSPQTRMAPLVAVSFALMVNQYKAKGANGQSQLLILLPISFTLIMLETLAARIVLEVLRA
ncbi:hypothetical protein L208DRAFT_1379304 [Tricholoma matsutake]|nr:hypothetical protein L208DRAFT_1379304 [Tricholoma matsutake 945]